MKPFIKVRLDAQTMIIAFCLAGIIFGGVPSVAYTNTGRFDRKPSQEHLFDSEKDEAGLGPSTSLLKLGKTTCHHHSNGLCSVGCVLMDDMCLLPEEVPNYEAIKSLHSQLDDDRSGDIDVSESVEFLKEELQYAKGYEKRQRVFHHDDESISVQELWGIWKKSEVHNWTVEQTVAWLSETVDLKQYTENFFENAVNGSILPRLAVNNEQFLTKVLGVRDPKHRSKLTIKAMDVVLFGPPKDTGSHIKDLILVTLLTLALIGCFKAYQRNREYEKQMGDMLNDMEKLREAEENLRSLEEKINYSSKVSQESQKADDSKLSTDEINDEMVQQLRLELQREREINEQMKEQLKHGSEESELEDNVWVAPLDLQHWLQLTFERERISFEKKQTAAREQFAQAREMCEKLNHQRRSLMGVLTSVHGRMDNVDQYISRARTILEEVAQELSERNHRWKNIEVLAGCSITNNAGLHTLELMLRPQVNGRPHSTYAPSIVQQLLSNQSALMFLTMGGYSNFDESGSLNSSAFIGTPTESLVDLRSNAGSRRRKRSELITQDSGSSLGSESSLNRGSTISHSRTCSGGLDTQFEQPVIPCIRRTSSTSSLKRLSRQMREQSKDSYDSSNDELDGKSCVSETSFSIGSSQITLNSESGSTVSPSQMGISASDSALDASKLISTRTRKSEEGNSSDNSLLEDRPPSATSKRKTSRWFRNGFKESLKIGKSKKHKDHIEKDSIKEIPNI